MNNLIDKKWCEHCHGNLNKSESDNLYKEHEPFDCIRHLLTKIEWLEGTVDELRDYISDISTREPRY